MAQIDMKMPKCCGECPILSYEGICVPLESLLDVDGIIRNPDIKRSECPLREDETQRLKDEIRRLDNENAALRKMLTAAALVGREG